MRRNTTGYDWTDEIVRRLRQLWREGHSTAEIGRRLAVSKNAVIGKAHRLDLPGRTSPIRRGSPARPRAARRQVPAPTPVAIVPSEAAPAVSVAAAPRPPEPATAVATSTERRSGPMQASRECCWPIGEPRTAGFRFCNAPVLARTSYCEAHARSAYVQRGNGNGEHTPAKPGR